jgi:hypothetical protein
VLTIEDIRNPIRISGFDHVGANGGSRPFQADVYGGKNDKAGRRFKGPRRATAEQAAQDYCDYVNGAGVAPAKQLRSAGHNGKRAKMSDDPEVQAALGVLRDARGQRAGRQGYVYCISDGEYVKIGYSTNPQARVAELQTGNARPLRLVYYFAGTEQDEADMHQKYIEQNVLQEWFRPNVELVLDFYHRQDRKDPSDAGATIST